jgi:hypothetical protein
MMVFSQHIIELKPFSQFVACFSGAGLRRNWLKWAEENKPENEAISVKRGKNAPNR